MGIILCFNTSMYSAAQCQGYRNVIPNPMKQMLSDIGHAETEPNLFQSC